MNEARLRAFRKISVRALGRQANKKSKRVRCQAKSISHSIQVFRFAVAWNSDFFFARAQSHFLTIVSARNFMPVNTLTQEFP